MFGGFKINQDGSS